MAALNFNVFTLDAQATSFEIIYDHFLPRGKSRTQMIEEDVDRDELVDTILDICCGEPTSFTVIPYIPYDGEPVEQPEVEE